MSAEVSLPQPQQNVPNAGPNVVKPEASEATASPGSSAGSANASAKPIQNSNVPPSKTEKPRPHICTECTRGFARLEHLKRHERSHTKEKPFECPDCQRCFARRDLLLRHQQKLHHSTAPQTRPRNRRESANAGPGAARVRKNSMAVNPNPATRRNTIATVDDNTLEMLANIKAINQRGPQLTPQMFQNLPGPASYQYNGMSSHHQLAAHAHLRLDTHAIPMSLGGGLRTAPALTSFGMNDFLLGGQNTVNPAQLSIADPSPFSQDDAMSPYADAFRGLQHGFMDHSNEGRTPDWMQQFDASMTFGLANESAIDQSSPSVMDTESPAGMLDMMSDAAVSTTLWGSPMTANAPVNTMPNMMDPLDGTTFAMDFAPGLLQDFGDHHMVEDPSPKTFMPHQTDLPEHAFGGPMFLNNLGMIPPSTLPPSMWNLPTLSDNASVSNTSRTSSHRHSSVTSVSTDTITDATRQALVSTLNSQANRKYSQSTINNTIAPRFHSSNLPSTGDLQRYVAAFFQHFHPHLPFLHIPTLKFDSPAFTSSLQTVSSQSHLGSNAITGGGGCLILAMAAIGACYEMETAHAKELYETGHKAIQIYLDERRRADLSAAVHKTKNSQENHGNNTPLWLVQAMLLTVIYGFNCGDKTSQEISSNHCSALVSLAKSAEISGASRRQSDGTKNGAESTGDDNKDWLAWKMEEERNRTFFAIYVLSSLVVSAFNQAPSLNNSEVKLRLPCSEDLWRAESAQAWRALKSQRPAPDNLLFSDALSWLVDANQREQQKKPNHGFGFNIEPLPEPEIKPSEFGCLILINALHNYICDTRQRHVNRSWLMPEFEAMYAKIEPALRAWQTLWKNVGHNSVERPNPYGEGPITADCVPLLDLAYVRLFVNFGRSKEAFWQRDFVLMAAELESAIDVAHPEAASQVDGRIKTEDVSMSSGMNGMNFGLHDSPNPDTSMPNQPINTAIRRGACSKKERMLRKAACYAADSLLIMGKLGLSYFDRSSHLLPLQCALSAFDCSQALAEWITCVQERVGPYLGILGKDAVDFGQVPGIMLLEEEDCKLIAKIDELLHNTNMKSSDNFAFMNHNPRAIDSPPILREGGYGSSILLSTARGLERASVWPVTILMAQALEVQASCMRERAERSRSQ